MNRWQRRSTWALAIALGAAGCEDPPAPAPPAAPAVNSTARTGANTANRRNAPGQGNDAGAPPPIPVTDQSFVESIAVRDPFRRFSNRIDIITTTDSRAVVLPRFSLDELRLVAVVLGTDSPYAMVKDPTNAGTILRRGMYVGRQEIIRSNVEGRTDYAVHWRVARISPARLRRAPDGALAEIPAEVVFEREDPLNPNAQVVERAVAMASQGVSSTQSQPPPSVGSALGMPIPGFGGPSPSFLPSNVPSGAQGPSRPGTTTTTTGGGQNGAPTTTTTVIVQTPPSAGPSGPTVVPLPSTPPPVVTTGGESPLR
ncbi:MAG: Type pilus biosis protein PilP [Myxococcaceae bacterium]|nr:Type pilus biosis protein PilP [Myxococcaceae bacterium]